MRHFSKTSWLAMVIIVFIIIAGFFAFQWWQAKGELGKKIDENESLIKQIEKLQKEIEKLKVVKEETTGWKAYRNEEYGYEVKYPKEVILTAKLTQPSLNYSVWDIVNFVTTRGYGPNLQDFHSIIFWIEVYDKPSKVSIKEWLSTGYQEDLSKIKDGDKIEKALKNAYADQKGIVSYTEYQERNIYEVGKVWDSYLSYARYLTKDGNKYIYGIGILLPFEKNEKILSIPDSRYIELFDQIFSNFKFTTE